jgi:hypothetical protein
MSDYDSDDNDNLDWSELAEDICVHAQGQIAIFIGFDGRSVALWQRRWPKDDESILISHRYLPNVIARLQRFADEIAADEQWAAAHPDEAAAERRAIQRELSGTDDDADNEDDPPPRATRRVPKFEPLPPLQPRLIADEWREPIATYLEGRQPVTVTEVVEAPQADAASTANQRRAADIMRDFGWNRRQRTGADRWWPHRDALGGAHRVVACTIASQTKRST